MAVQAFDLAERLQTPVFVMLDLDIGMNDWMSPDFQWDDAWRPDRGKMLTPEQIAGIEKFQRYLDPDGDGIPYRTLPGISPKAAYFTRGSGHSRFGAYTEDSAEYQDVLDRLTRKFATAAKHVPPPVIDGRGAATAIVSLGSCDAPVREALAGLRKSGVAIDYMRVRGFPFGAEVEEFLAAHQTIFVVEQNRDAQLRALLTLETAVDKKKLRSILHYNGLSDDRRLRRRRRREGARQGGGRMSFIAKPKVANPGLPRNDLGLNRRDYEGSMSTLCAGCGHDSVTAAIVQACFELSMPPQSVVKLSGIGCSSKTTAYFVAGAHGFNAVHGRMPSIATGRATRPTATCATSASRATAIRSRSASASSRTRSAATSTWSTSSRTTASTASPRASSRPRRTSARSRRRARRTSSSRSTRSCSRSRSARPSSRAASPATRSSSCR